MYLASSCENIVYGHLLLIPIDSTVKLQAAQENSTRRINHLYKHCKKAREGIDYEVNQKGIWELKKYEVVSGNGSVSIQKKHKHNRVSQLAKKSSSV